MHKILVAIIARFSHISSNSCVIQRVDSEPSVGTSARNAQFHISRILPKLLSLVIFAVLLSPGLVLGQQPPIDPPVQPPIDPPDPGQPNPGQGGVQISAEGVLSTRMVQETSGRLNRERAAAAKRMLNRDLATQSKMRKISLIRLEAEIEKLKAIGQDVPYDMQFLAGMTRITHVFYYPETKDIVIAGPAEGFFLSTENRVIGTETGAATLHLEDLIVALRAFGPDGSRAKLISCSIDPTQEGLANLKEAYKRVAQRFRPGDELATADAFRQALGLQEITIEGVSPKTRFASVLVDADYHMKLIGIGLEGTPIGITSFVDAVKPASGGGNGLQRWYFQPNYECVRGNNDGTGMQLVGSGVKLVGANESIADDGTRTQTRKTSRASTVFCKSFTKKYDRLAESVPLFGELRNCVDMSIAAAFIQDMDFYGQAGWNMELFGDENQFATEVYTAPTHVAPAVNALWKDNLFMTPIGGGVNIQPRKAIRSDTMQVNQDSSIDDAMQDDKVAALRKGQWWWD